MSGSRAFEIRTGPLVGMVTGFSEETEKTQIQGVYGATRFNRIYALGLTLGAPTMRENKERLPEGAFAPPRRLKTTRNRVQARVPESKDASRSKRRQGH